MLTYLAILIFLAILFVCFAIFSTSGRADEQADRLYEKLRQDRQEVNGDN